MHQQQLLFPGNEAIFAKVPLFRLHGIFSRTLRNNYVQPLFDKRQTKRINMKQMEEIEFSLHPICVVGEIKSGRAPIKSEHKNLEHSQTSHKQVKIQRK